MDRNKISEMILEGEEIIYTFKPYYKKVVYRTIISLLIAIVPFILFLLFPIVFKFPQEMMTIIIISTAVMVVMVTIPLLIPLFMHKNRFYAVTNKRLIIQKGFFGIDFAFLPIESVQYVSVSVSPLDRYLKKGTGTISFGAVSTPVTSKSGATFAFGDIGNVYENYKIIKTFIDKNKEGQQKS